MEVDLIFLPRDESLTEADIKSNLDNMLNTLFSDVYANSFTIKLDEKEEFFFYEYNISSDNILYLKIKCKTSDARAAKYLNKAICAICKGKHKGGFYIIKSYDEVSMYCCNMLMPYFGEFERKLRQVLYITFVKSYKKDWYESGVQDVIKQDIVSRSKGEKNKLIEKALEFLTYEQLKNLLFDKYPQVDFYGLSEMEYTESKLEMMSKSEIIAFISQCRKQSTWERFFSDDEDLAEIESEISYLQDYRNIVMHHKTIEYDKYLEIRKKLKRLNQGLDNAIDKLNREIYSRKANIGIAAALSILADSIKIVCQPYYSSIAKRISDSFSETLLPAMSVLSKSLQESFKGLDSLSSLDLYSQNNNECLPVENFNEESN